MQILDITNPFFFQQMKRVMTNDESSITLTELIK